MIRNNLRLSPSTCQSFLLSQHREGESSCQFLIRIGFPQGHYWLRAESCPTPSSCVKLAMALGITESELLDGMGVPFMESVAMWKRMRDSQAIITPDLKPCIRSFQQYQTKLHAAKYKEKNRVQILDKLREYNVIRNAAAKAARGPIQTIRKARKDLAAINKQIDHIIVALNRESIYAQRRGIAADRRRNAHNRRVKYRRRIDPKWGKEHGANPQLWRQLMTEYDYRCAYCGKHQNESKRSGYNLQIDHIIPITTGPSVQGLSNSALACLSCNASKGNRDLLDWLIRKPEKQAHPKVIMRYAAQRGLYAA